MWVKPNIEESVQWEEEKWRSVIKSGLDEDHVPSKEKKQNTGIT